ncbi:hypothetical protein QBC47DRAFT_128193 [Echria macrotheca]|uniref:Uncharacterized protein n=1 Tax=Echria macrotheca TaxID=438768 RepID=A0AAJ0B2I8_9PEZI|nr:hypothetical protein QBC47DRAFT_128193 [Echria macrotheca]
MPDVNPSTNNTNAKPTAGLKWTAHGSGGQKSRRRVESKPLTMNVRPRRRGEVQEGNEWAGEGKWVLARTAQMAGCGWCKGGGREGGAAPPRFPETRVTGSSAALAGVACDWVPTTCSGSQHWPVRLSQTRPRPQTSRALVPRASSTVAGALDSSCAHRAARLVSVVWLHSATGVHSQSGLQRGRRVGGRRKLATAARRTTLNRGEQRTGGQAGQASGNEKWAQM